MRLPYWLHDLRSKAKYHPNKLRIKTLKRGWVDCDHQLLHASMQILCNFVEHEKNANIVNWDFDSDHLEAAKTIDKLYYWWKNDPLARNHWLMPDAYDAKQDPFNAIEDWLHWMYHAEFSEFGKWAFNIVKKCRKANKMGNEATNQRLYYKCLNQIEAEAIRRQDKMLHNLIEIRGFLWT